jgi:pyruvate dehydrogenase E1 component alpha subunit
MRGHYEGDPAKYRELAQLAEWKKQDPIARVERALRKTKLATSQELKAIEADTRALVERAANFALSSPWPSPEAVDDAVYAEAK